MSRNITILRTGTFIPERKVYNEFFVGHFNKYGIKSEGLMEHLGRGKRYLATEKDTSLSMGLSAAQSSLMKINVLPEELDLIIFVSDTPEYLMPLRILTIIYFHNYLILIIWKHLKNLE